MKRVINSAQNESTPILVTPTAPSKKPSPPGLSLSIDSPTSLNLSNIDKSSEGNHSRLERQNAVDGTPEKLAEEVANMSNLSIVDAIDRNTSQLHEMFGNLTRHVNEIEQEVRTMKRLDNNQAEKDENEQMEMEDTPMQ